MTPRLSPHKRLWAFPKAAAMLGLRPGCTNRFDIHIIGGPGYSFGSNPGSGALLMKPRGIEPYSLSTPVASSAARTTY